MSPIDEYIEPHAGDKRINDFGELVKLYSLREAFIKHMKHALVICKDKRALSYGSTEAFDEFIVELDERFKTAGVATLRRIIFALRNVLKMKVKDLVKMIGQELFEAMVFVGQNADQLEFTWEEVFEEYKKLLREAAAAAAAAT